MKKVLCWLLALLLTGTLALFGVSWAASGAVEPGLKEGGSVVTDRVQEREMQLIREKIDELAPAYEFNAETVRNFFTPEKVSEMNRQAALWWNGILVNGEAGEVPAAGAEELTAALLEDFGTEEADGAADARASDAANAVSESVLRIILPMRLPVIGIGLGKAAERVDLTNVIRFLLGIRWAALALCFLLAGLIALLESRKLRNSLQYIGSAFGAAVLVLLGGYVLYLLSGVDRLIAGASPSLSVQYGSLLMGAAVPLLIFAGLLIIGCIGCLVCFRRLYEAEAD